MHIRTDKKLKVLLAANPSHITRDEHIFWKGVARQARKRGWRVVEIAQRALPYTRNAETVSIPARLWELNRKLRKIDIPPGDRGCLWANTDYLKVQEDWEHRRWGLAGHNPEVMEGLKRLICFVDESIKLIRPSAVLTTNKIDHNCTLFREAAKHYRIYTSVVERSPFDGIWLEPDGLFAESVIWREYEKAKRNLPKKAIRTGEKVIKKMLSNPYGFRKEARGAMDFAITEAERPLFFLPMDNVLWTGWEQRDHPMRAVDNPLYESPLEGIRDIAEKVHIIGGTLVVKRHPACLHIRQEALPEGVLHYESDIQLMLEKADVIVVFNTKVAFPALAMGKPVVTLAPNPAACSGATYHCLERSGVLDTLKKALAREGLEEKLACFVPFAGWLESRFFYSCRTSFTMKGPKEFVDDIIKAAPGGAALTEAELAEAMEKVRRLAVAKPSPNVVTGTYGNMRRAFFRMLSRYGVVSQ